MQEMLNYSFKVAMKYRFNFVVSGFDLTLTLDHEILMIDTELWVRAITEFRIARELFHSDSG